MARRRRRRRRDELLINTKSSAGTESATEAQRSLGQLPQHETSGGLRQQAVMNMQQQQGNQAVQRALTGEVQREDDSTSTTTTDEPDSDTIRPDAARFQQAWSLYLNGEYEAAIVLLEQVRHMETMDQDHEAILIFNLGMCNYQLYRYVTAAAYFETVLRHPGADETIVERAQEELALARSRANIQTDDPGGLVPPAVEASDESMDLYDEAAEAYDAGDYRRAAILVERVRNHPGTTARGQAICLANAGRCNVHLGRYEAALMYFRSALEHPGLPDEFRAEVEQALIDTQRQAGLEVTDTADDGQQSSGSAADAMRERLLGLYQNEQYRGVIMLAEQIRQQASASDETRIVAVYYAGLANYELNRFVTATSYLGMVVRHEALPPDLRQLAQARLEQAKRRSGLAAIEEKIADGLAPAAQQAAADELYQDARAAYDSGRYPRAINLLEQALRYNQSAENQAVLMFNIARSNQQLNRLPAALIYFENAVMHSGATEEIIQAAIQRIIEVQEAQGLPADELIPRLLHAARVDE